MVLRLEDTLNRHPPSCPAFLSSWCLPTPRVVVLSITRTRRAMCSNWTVRSGQLAPSQVFRLSCNEYPNERSTSAIFVRPTVVPCRLSASLIKLARILQAQRSGVCRSPRSVSSTSRSIASIRCGCLTSNDLRPPPCRRCLVLVAGVAL